MNIEYYPYAIDCAALCQEIGFAVFERELPRDVKSFCVIQSAPYQDFGVGKLIAANLALPYDERRVAIVTELVYAAQYPFQQDKPFYLHETLEPLSQWEKESRDGALRVLMPEEATRNQRYRTISTIRSRRTGRMSGGGILSARVGRAETYKTITLIIRRLFPMSKVTVKMDDKIFSAFVPKAYANAHFLTLCGAAIWNPQGGETESDEELREFMNKQENAATDRDEKKTKNAPSDDESTDAIPQVSHGKDIKKEKPEQYKGFLHLICDKCQKVIVINAKKNHWRIYLPCVRSYFSIRESGARAPDLRMREEMAISDQFLRRTAGN